MNDIIPFDGSVALPAYLKNRDQVRNINDDISLAAPYPTMSVRGKVFTIVRDGVRTKLMKPAPDNDEVAQKIEVAVLRANMHSRIFYLKEFDEGGDNNAPPDCFSMDGQKPVATAPNKQSDFCNTCPHSVWGTGNTEKGTGRRCSDAPRLAIATPDKLEEPYLLRLPPASIKNWKEAVKIGKQRNLQYNMLVYRISFDADASTPLLLFRPTGLLSDAAYAKANDEMYDSELVRSVVGLDEPAAPARAPAPAPAPDPAASELDAAIAAKAATAKAKATKPVVTETELDSVAPPPKPTPAPAPKAEPAKATKPVVQEAAGPAPDGDLLAGLSSLLGGGTDD